MVWRRVTLGLGAAALVALACGREGDMPETMELPDTMPVMRALEDARVRDSMLDTMPGGEMARGDSAAAVKLLEQKRESR